MTDIVSIGNDSDTIKMSIVEAASMLGVVERTVYRKIKKYNWRHEQDEDARAWVWIPKSYIDRCQSMPGQKSDPIRHVSEPIKPMTGTRPTQTENSLSNIGLDLDAVINRVTKLYDDQLADLRKQIDDLKEDKKILNRQVESTNTQLVKYRELDKEVKDLKEAKQKPWWKFWA